MGALRNGEKASLRRRGMTIELAGEEVELLAERALWRPASRSLLIADTHWGLAATPRHASMGIALGASCDDLDRLTGLLESKRPERLIVLGDLIHARQGSRLESLDAVTQWRRKFRELPIALVRGNHEIRRGDPPVGWGIECFDEPWRDGPFALRHTPGANAGAYVLAGHLHPKFRGTACFRIGPESAILPAFNVLAGGGGFQHRPGERVFLIRYQEVSELQTDSRAWIL
jgi:DNA ligase-associated metallophosphoesterase